MKVDKLRKRVYALAFAEHYVETRYTMSLITTHNDIFCETDEEQNRIIDAYAIATWPESSFKAQADKEFREYCEEKAVRKGYLKAKREMKGTNQ